MKRFLECGHPNNELERGKETSSFAPDPSEFRRLAEVAAEAQGLPAPTDGKMPGTRPLIAAAVSGHRHVAWELLLSSADVNATDSDGLTALSAASCSMACDIHMWFLLHRAAGQTQKQRHQSSSTEAEIQGNEVLRSGMLDRMLWDRNHQEEETLILRMLVTLLRGKGPDFTEMVDGLLKKAGSPIDKLTTDSWSRERLRERERDRERERERERDIVRVGVGDTVRVRVRASVRVRVRARVGDGIRARNREIE